MYSIILTVLVICLFFMVSNQSVRIRRIKSLLSYLQKEIIGLKDQLAELKKKPFADSRAIPPLKKTSDAFSFQTAEPENQTESQSEIPEYVQSDQPYEEPAAIKEPEPPTSAAQGGKSIQSINWEDFLGAKLFAWIGGFSLFIGFAFLLKYSFDHNLISPAVRVAIGFICGAGLVGSGIYLKRKTYEVTSQTLCATGIVILYASTFAANSVYHFISTVVAFALMSLITAGVFVLAAGAGARVIAILGIVGGFITPPLLSTGQDHPFALFSYITFLNVGLFCVAFYRKWNFLVALGALGTVLTQLGWSISFFKPEKIFIAMAIYLWFNLLFCGAFWYGKRIERSDRWLAGSSVSLPFVTFLFALFLAVHPITGIRPGAVFTYLLVADLCLLAIALMEEKLQKFHLAAGGCIFLILSLWITIRMTPELLIWALGGSLVFALLHSAFPMIAARITPSARIPWHVHLSPLLALLLILIPILKGSGGWLIWPFVLLFNGGILALALLTTSALAILVALVITGIVILGWIFRGTTGSLDTGETVILIGAFGIFFSVVATYVLIRMKHGITQTRETVEWDIPNPFGISNPDNIFMQIPAFSTALPFVLLIFVSSSVEIHNPAPILGLGLLLTAIGMWLVRLLKATVLLPITMGCFFLLEDVVHLGHFHPDNAIIFLGFYILTTALFFILPFFYRQDYLRTVIPWATAALSGPLHFFLIYDTVQKTYPNNIMGLLPAIMAVPYFLGLMKLVEWIPKDHQKRDSIFAWFGGATLFFITLILPIQFEHQWLTIGWTLEGAALIWLFRIIPHPGLRGLGVALLLAIFLRLGMNPAILSEYPPSAYPIFNWYLYTYGIAIFCLMSGARLLAPPRNKTMGFNTPPVLYALGTILAFIFMNIEIADFFSTGIRIRFQFTGDFAPSMTYSIAWALFAFALIVVGILKKLRPVRLAAIGLIGITLVKLFFFDLRQLDQLYRIGAFVGVAIVLIAASALYQKWVVRKV